MSLQTAYSQRDSIHKYLKKVFALPFLSADHIRPAFDKLKDQASDQLLPFMEYVETNWMESSVWPISSWCMFGRSMRTNNDVEGWHHRLNQRAKKGNLPFYLAVTLLYKEASLIPTQVKMVSEGKLKRYQRLQTRETQGKLMDLWEQYSARHISVNTLLKKCGKIYCPM